MIEILPAFIILIGLILLNCPIYASILAASAYLSAFVVHQPLHSMISVIFEGLNKGSLLCIPFFVLAGNMISGGTLGKRLINLFRAAFDDVRGGLPLASVIANGIFGAISGSGPAAISVFGNLIYEPISEQENEKMGIGILACVSCLAGIIPPGTTMIIYAVAAETSVARQFMAGIIPGLLMMIFAGTYLVFASKPRNGQKTFSWKLLGKAFWEALPVLGLPIIVMGGIYSGITTPTEAGALSAVYAFVAGVIMHEFDAKKLLEIFKDSAKFSFQVYMIIGVSTYLSRMMSLAQIPRYIMGVFQGVGRVEFLLIVNVLLIICGCFFENIAAITILTPILLPIATNLGISPIQLGMIMVLNLSIGTFTPPFGLHLFVVQGVLPGKQKTMGELVSACVPFFFLYMAVLMIVTFVPAVSEFIPSLLIT